MFPLYFPLLEPASGLEIVAHRVVWSLVFIGVLLTALRAWPRVRGVIADRRAMLILLGGAVLFSCNWLIFVYGVTSGQVVETSLGYFINPLVSVLLGVVVLSERLRTAQWVAVGIAMVAVLALTVEYGHPPWVALILAFSFGSYGLAKKKANAGAVESLAIETMVVSPVALVYVLFLVGSGASTFGNHGALHVALVMGTGVVTVLPLLCFGGAATRIPLSTLGLMQYLTPTVQFVLGLVVFGEPMPPMRWLGFGLIWLALALFTFETLRNRHRTRAGAQERETVAV